MDTELLPCPHGNEARIINIGGVAPFSIYLGPNHACHRTFGWFATRAEAIAAWNRRTATSPDGVEERVAFQQRVGKWMETCFTAEIIADKLERADRFIEEALELVQATGYSAERAHALVDYTFNRPIGEAFQEVGGVKVTLAALCNPHNIDMDAAAETELARVWTKIDKIRAKQATKPVGSALPIPIAAISAEGDE